MDSSHEVRRAVAHLDAVWGMNDAQKRTVGGRRAVCFSGDGGVTDVLHKAVSVKCWL